jgi:hypothetical protein
MESAGTDLDTTSTSRDRHGGPSAGERARGVTRAARPVPVLALTLAALAVAVAARAVLLGAKPFWRDEAWIAWLIELPPATRGHVLHVTPAGFLALTRALALLLPGVAPEVAYRLLPLAAGLATVALLPALARRAGASDRAALACLWLAAGLPALVYYSRELKSYALDALWAVAVPLLVWDLAEPRPRAGAVLRALALAGLVCAAPWLAYGALFPTGAALGWLAWRLARHGSARRRLAALAIAVLFASALAAAFVVYLRAQIGHPMLPDMWRDVLGAPGGPTALPRMLWTVHAVSVPYLLPGVWLAGVALAALGTASLPRPSLLLSGLVLSAAGAGLAAAANLYLVSHGRFLLFLAPPWLVLAAAGLVRGGERALGRVHPVLGRWCGVAVAVLAGLWWAGDAVARRRPAEPRRPEPFVYDVIQDVRPLVDWLRVAGVPPAKVLVSRHAREPVRYYGRDRLRGALMLGHRDHAYGPVVDAWLSRVPDEAWLLLVDEEVPGYREVLERRGFAIEPAVASRGGVVLRVRPASLPRTR